MKILYITLENLSLYKGSVVHVREVVSGLRRRGHRVGLMARAWDQTDDASPFHNIHPSVLFFFKPFVRKKKSYFLSSLLLFLALFRVLRQYDVIYARDFHATIIALFPRLIFRKPLVFEINGLAGEEQKLKGDSLLRRILSFFICRAERIAANHSDRIVSVTPYIADYLIQSSCCLPDRIKVVSNGVDTKKFYPVEDNNVLSDWKKKLGIEDGESIVVFVGNLAPWQGVQYLIRVAPWLIEATHGIKFLIIGNGSLRGEFEEEVKRLGLSKHFIFTGMVGYEDIPLYINVADVCVTFKRRLKSGYSPIKLYEYMACGKPVVASRVEGLEFIEKEGAGLLAEPEDVTSLRRVLIDLLGDPEMRASMGRRGLQIVRERFDWKMKVMEIEKVLEELA